MPGYATFATPWKRMCGGRRRASRPGREQVRAAESAISLALVGNLTPYDPIYQQRMAGFTAALTPLIGAPPQAARQAHGLMYLLVQQQASYQAFMAVFGWSAVLTATAVLARY